jgi:hypothetical protein
VTDKELSDGHARLSKKKAYSGISSVRSQVQCGMFRVAANHFAVVIFPDSGSRYLSKVFDDKWMRENGLLGSAWEAIRLSEVLLDKPHSDLFTVSVDDRMTDVIARLKEHDISQMPVLKADGTLAGLVSEVDLLKHLLEASHTHKPEETIESIVEPSIPVFVECFPGGCCPSSLKPQSFLSRR